MAGLYNDAPSTRMAYDGDGTVALRSGLSTFTIPPAGGFGTVPWTDAIPANGNDETQTSYASQATAGTVDAYLMCCLIFPEPRELEGMYVQIERFEGSHWIYYSTDTTNGIDGNWTTTGVSMVTTTTVDHYRDNITSLAISNVKSVKTLQGATSNTVTTYMRRFHFYGAISPAETPDRILFLDTENADATFTKVLDFGDVPRGQTTTRTFKIKNNSASKTIETVQVTAEDLYLNAGDWYEFGDDGVNYQGTFSVGNMSNGAEETIHLKQVIPGGETLGVQAGRIKVSHASVS